MTAQLTTAGAAAVNGGAAFDENLIHEIRFGTSQDAPTTNAQDVVTAPTSLRSPVSGAAAWEIAAVRSTDGRIATFRSPSSDLARAFTAYEIGVFNTAGVMVFYEAGESAPLLQKLANVVGWHNLGLVLSGLASAPPSPTFSTAMPIPATENLAGLIELANQAEADAGTASDRAMTPALVKRLIDAIPAPTPRAIDFQRFTAHGTWTKPAGARVVRVEVIGGGGGGGGKSGYGTNAYGGNAGKRNVKWFNATDLGATEPVIVGLGGAGASRPALIGTNGGWSRFGPDNHQRGVRAPGGVNWDGTQGYDGVTRYRSEYSRGGDMLGRDSLGGAGGYSPSRNGGSRGSQTSNDGGAGGSDPLGMGSGGGASYNGSVGSAGVNTIPATGGAGGVPGGGGGAGGVLNRQGRAGAGARGEVRVWTF